MFNNNPRLTWPFIALCSLCTTPAWSQASATLTNAAPLCSPAASQGNSQTTTTLITATGAGIAPAPGSGKTFHLAENNNIYRIDTGAGLVVDIRRTARPGSHQGPGDIVSLNYNGAEYQDQSKGSQFNSGFGGLYPDQHGVTVQAGQPDAQHIKVTVTAGDLTHYYLFRRGVPAVYMADYFTREPKPGLARFVVRITHNRLSDGPSCAEESGNLGPVESHDIFRMSNGDTRSKHYSNSRIKDWAYFGATGQHVGAWIIRDNNEGGSGGPFYRSLKIQGASDQELTYIINYGETQTEPFRTSILDSYTLLFTNGSSPTGIDTSWFEHMDLRGYVPAARRGSVFAHHLNPDGQDMTLGLSSRHAQYWGDVDAQGNSQIIDILPGRYQATLYHGELAVAQQTVTIQAGARTPLPAFTHLNDPATSPAVWRIGRWDGKPGEFLNGDKLTWMHPSDPRINPWQTGVFIVGKSSVRHFPASQWRDINSPEIIHFSLRPDQVAQKELRIGITDAWAGGRPVVRINDWQSHIPPATLQPETRSITVGSYRGNNTMLVYPIPQGVLKAGDNTLTISIASGQHASGFLSPGVAYDALDLITRQS